MRPVRIRTYIYIYMYCIYAHNITAAFKEVLTVCGNDFDEKLQTTYISIIGA